MQKKLMYIVFLLLTVCSKAAAQDLMTVSSFSLGAGDTKEVGVQLTNADTYVGFQFDLYLPQGFTVESFTAGSRLPSGTTPQMAQQADGSYRFVAAALSGNAITGNSGSVLTLTVKAADAATAGSYDGYLRNVKISRADGSGVTIAEQSFTVTVLEDEPYAVLDGTTLTFYYDKKKEERGGMSVGPFASSADREWDNAASTITAVVFDTSFADCTTLTSTAYWFYQCSNLTSIQGITNLNTASVTDMNLMFWSCSSFTSLDLRSFNTANVIYMYQMFGNCSGLTSLDVSGFNTTQVTNMAMMFNNCSSLTSLDLSAFNTAHVTYMNGCFLGCSALTTVYVGADWSTAAVAEGGDMFTLCPSLVGGAFTTFDSNHTDHNYAHIDGGTQNPGYLTSIADKAEVAAVFFSRSLYELTMSCATENVRIMYAVITDPTAEPQYEQYTAPITLTADCTVRAYAVRPSGIQSEVAEYTFSMSDVLKVEKPTMSWSGDEMTLATVTADATIHYILDDGATTAQEQVYTAPVTVTSDVTISAWATKDEMQNSDILTIVYPYTAWNALAQTISEAQQVAREAATSDNVPAQMLSDLQYQIDIAVTAYEIRTASEAEIAERRAALEAIMAEVRERINAVAEPYAVLSDNNTLLTFYYDKKKEERGGMSVGPFNGYPNYQAWYDNRESITTAVFDSSFANCTTLTSTVFWFFECSNLTSIQGIENLSTVNVTDMSYMFDGCSSLTNLDLSTFNTANVTNMSWMFFRCSSLTNLNMSGFNTAKVTNMDNMFNGCTNLVRINVSEFNTVNVTGMVGMFRECSGLSSLDVSGFNTTNVTRMDYMFYGSSSLTTIYVGENWSITAVTESENMFTGCTALVGGQGTTYNPDHVDAGYAHIDGGAQNPGYLTDINSPAYGTTIYVKADTAPHLYAFNAATNESLNGDFPGDEMTETAVVGGETFWTKRIPYEQPFEINLVDANAQYRTQEIYVVSDRFFTWDGASGYTDVTAQYGEPKEIVITSLALPGDHNEWSCTALFDTVTPGVEYTTELDLTNYSAASSQFGFKLFANGGAWLGSTALEISAPDYVKANDGVDTWASGRNIIIELSATSVRRFLLNAVWGGGSDMEHGWKLTVSEIQTDTVAAPTFSWQGDELTITTATVDAELFYQLSDTDVDGDGTVTDADYVLYTAPVEIRRNVTVKAYAAKQGLVNSDVTTLVYPYEAWERLMNTIKYAEEVVAQCQGSTKVTQQELDELALEARRASGLYNERTMTETEILDYAKALEAAANEIWTRHNSTDGDYSFDTATGVLTLQNGMTVTEAVNTIGGQVAESVTAILWQNTTALTATDLAVVSNPNLLVYVADSTLAPAGRDNVVADGVAKNVVLTSQGTGNIDFYCPQAFTARRISYTREFVQQTTIGVSRGWESIALPFTVQRVEHQTQGAIVPFGSTEPGYRFWLRQLTANGLQGAQTIEANVGYLISMPNSSEYTEGNLGGVVTFSAENAEVPVTRPVVSESAQHALLPSFRRMAAQQGVYVLNVSAPRNGYAEGSIFEENYRELLPFQAYTEHLGTQPAPPYFVIGKMGGEGTTGIADVRADVEDTDYYDLNGRRLQGKPRQKGVYIRQGRKVIVR